MHTPDKGELLFHNFFLDRLGFIDEGSTEILIGDWVIGHVILNQQSHL